jgi:hypothetical protein
MKSIREIWHSMLQPEPAPKPVQPEVIVHDPAAEGPHDLDDPFFDPKVQSRIADVIAGNTIKKN